MSRILEVEGDLDGALGLLEEAERVYMSDFSPNVSPIATMKARVWIAQSRLGEALGWARAQSLSAEDSPSKLSYLLEFNHITLARLLLAQYKSAHTEHHIDHALRDALDLLERLLKAAEQGGRTGSMIDILLLQSLTHHAQGDMDAALVPIQQALMLAEPEDYVRTFVDEGPPMAQLLLEAASRGLMPEYIGRLLAAFEAEQEGSVGKSPLPVSPLRASATPTSLASQPFTEPLSQRELEVLRLFRTELSGPEIARELVISLSTVRTHTKGIYSKLNVNSRRAAVKRAADLNLV